MNNESMNSESQSSKSNEVMDSSNLISDQNDQTSLMKNKEEGHKEADHANLESKTKKRNNLIMTKDGQNISTPKVFIANVKSEIGKKFSSLISNVPRSIVYSKTFDNLKAIFSKKTSQTSLVSSSSNNINKLQIQDDDAMEQYMENDQSVSIIILAILV